MRRLRTLRALTVVFGMLTAADLVVLLVIVIRNSYTSSLISTVTVLGIVGIVLVGATLVLLGIWRDIVRTNAQQPVAEKTVEEN